MKGFFSILLLLLLPQGSFSAGIQAFKPEFSAVVNEDAQLVEIATGLQFTEGPVWIGSGESGYLLFSDIPADKIYPGHRGRTFRCGEARAATPMACCSTARAGSWLVNMEAEGSA